MFGASFGSARLWQLWFTAHWGTWCTCISGAPCRGIQPVWCARHPADLQRPLGECQPGPVRIGPLGTGLSGTAQEAGAGQTVLQPTRNKQDNGSQTEYPAYGRWRGRASAAQARQEQLQGRPRPAVQDPGSGRQPDRPQPAACPAGGQRPDHREHSGGRWRRAGHADAGRLLPDLQRLGPLRGQRGRSRCGRWWRGAGRFRAAGLDRAAHGAGRCRYQAAGRPVRRHLRAARHLVPGPRSARHRRLSDPSRALRPGWRRGAGSGAVGWQWQRRPLRCPQSG